MKKLAKSLSLLILLAIPMVAFSAGNAESSEVNVPAGSDVSTAASEAVESKSSEESAPPKRATLTARTEVLTVNNDPVYWPEFLFWVKYIGKYYKAAMGMEEITDWETEQNGMGLREFFLSTAVGYARKDRAIEAMAGEMGVGLTEEDITEMEERRDGNIKIYGSVSEYRRIVASMYVSEEVFTYLTKMDYLGNHLFEHLFGENGENFSDREIAAFIREGGFMCAKYIFLSNLDTDGHADAQKRTENAAILHDLIARLDASEEPLSLFTGLMNQFGQDETLAQFPNGRLITAGARGEAFESAYLDLSENEYSGVVTTGAGCYIILRLPIFPAMKADASGNTLRYWAAYETFKKRVEEWSEKMEVEYREAYDGLDIEGLF